MRWSLIVITVLYLVLVGTVFAVTSNEVSVMRGDFCVFAATAHSSALKLPQVPGRVQAEHGYARLERQLGCPP